jgi:hydrogenase maturation protease
MAMSNKILIAGVGNIFLGDDAFGVEVVAELARRELPSDVQVADFGIRGLDLAYALLDDYSAVILVDAVSRGGRSGDLYVIAPNTATGPDDLIAETPLIDTHAMNPEKVLRLVHTLGGTLSTVRLVGCEPSPLDDYEEMQPGLSDAVRNAIPIAMDLILGIVTELRAEGVTAGTSDGAAAAPRDLGHSFAGPRK